MTTAPDRRSLPLVIRKRGTSYQLVAKTTGKVLGTHVTKAAANRQERAVQASKHAPRRKR
mgnify:CR=1 FL=1